MKHSAKLEPAERELVYSRFYARRLPRGLGVMLAGFCGFFLVMTILAMLEDTSIFLILVSILMSLALLAGLIVGILAILASFESICLRRDGVQVRLGKLVLFRIPAKQIRSMIATTKEYRERMTDKQVYMVRLYWDGRHPKNLALWFQWAGKEMEDFQRVLPDVDYLL